MARKQKGWSLSLSSRAPALGGLNTCHKALPLKGLHLPRTLLEPTRFTHGPWRFTHGPWRDIEDLNPSRSSACLHSPPTPCPGVCLSQELALPYSCFPQLDPRRVLLHAPLKLSPACPFSCLQLPQARLAWMAVAVPLRSSSVDCRDCPGHIPHAVGRHLPQLSAKFWMEKLI